MSPDWEFHAEALVPAAREEVFAFLSDLENHWRLAHGRVAVLELTGPRGARTGGSIRLQGPFGSGRRAQTSVTATDPPGHMSGRAELSGKTVAAVSWTLLHRDSATLVQLRGRIESLGAMDRVLLALGGRRWMQRMFGEVLGALAVELAARGVGERAESAA